MRQVRDTSESSKEEAEIGTAHEHIFDYKARNASIQKALQSQCVQCQYNKCSTTSVSSVISSALFGDFTTEVFTYNAAYPRRQAVKSKTMIF